MDVSPQDARQSLDQVHDAMAQTRRAVVASSGGLIFMLWGAVWIVAFTVSHFLPRWSGWTWLTLDLVGVVGTLLILFGRGAPLKLSPAGRNLGWRIFIFWLCLNPFIAVWLLLLAPFNGLQVFAFICTVPMFALVVMGLWIRVYTLVVVGFAVTDLIVLGYLRFPTHFNPWTALTGGGTMLVVGLLHQLRLR